MFNSRREQRHFFFHFSKIQVCHFSHQKLFAEEEFEEKERENGAGAGAEKDSKPLQQFRHQSKALAFSKV